MIPEYPSFEPIAIGHRKDIGEHLERHAMDICEHSFTNLYVWRDFDRPMFTMMDGALCILINPVDEGPFFLEPIGAVHPREIFDICLGHAGKVSRISSPFMSRAGIDASAALTIDAHRDYVYKTRDLAELRGRRFDGKRNHIRRFEKATKGYSVKELSPSHFDAAMKLYYHWCAVKSPRASDLNFPMLAYSSEGLAIQRAFEDFVGLGLFGYAAMVGKRLTGFSILSRLHANTACMHFCHCDPEIAGLSTAFQRDVCSKISGRFEFINLEQDLGLSGLRKMKLSYHPVRIEQKYEISRQVP
jgi:hypothetical protein